MDPVSHRSPLRSENPEKITSHVRDVEGHIVLFAEHQRRTFWGRGVVRMGRRARREEGRSEDGAGPAAGPRPQHSTAQPAGPEAPPLPQDGARVLAPAQSRLAVALGSRLWPSTPCGGGGVGTGVRAAARSRCRAQAGPGDRQETAVFTGRKGRGLCVALTAGGGSPEHSPGLGTDTESRDT